MELMDTNMDHMEPIVTRSFNSIAGLTSSTGLGLTLMHWNILANSLAFGNNNFTKVPEEYL